MLSKLILGLTGLAFVVLVAVNIYKPKGTGDQLVGWGFILFGVLAAYVVCSLLLTINITLNGKLNWISESASLRNIIISIGWLCLMSGVVYSTMINSDWQTTGTANLFGLIMIRYGAIWIPLLMLVPYAILLNPEWQNSVSSTMFKIPLLAGCLIGLGFHFMSNTVLVNLFQDKNAVSNSKYQEGIKRIEFEDSTEGLLYYMFDGTDVRLTQAALTKLKKNENLESDLVNILNKGEEMDYRRVIAYLENNKVEHPELFIAPLNKTISIISEELKYRLQSFGSENDYLELLNVDGLCHVLNMQFKAYNEDFRPCMLLMQTELLKEPKPDFIEIRNKYKMAVKNWLDAN